MYLRIWERYFLLEVIKSALFFLFTFYGLYILIDYASHTSSLHRHNIYFQWRELVLYYFCEFIRRLEVLLPFSLLIATIRTISCLNEHNELIALMSSGISLKSLMRPFLLVGLAATGLMYLNVDFFLPQALTELRHIETLRARSKEKNNGIHGVQHLLLEDQSTLLFDNFDPIDKQFLDAYWIRNIDDIYHIKVLTNPEEPNGIPFGDFVDRLKRNKEGDLIVADSYRTKQFPDMHFNKKTLFETLIPPEDLSTTELWKKLPSNKEELNEKEAQLFSVFFHKLLMPWLCFFVVIGPMPFCIRTARGLSKFIIYSVSIFGLVAFYLLMSASLLLGKRQVLLPAYALFPPFIIAAAPLLYRYFRL